MSIDERGPLTRRLLPDGEEPDARFTLANERTFLAWIRTALAFIAGGIAVEAFTGDLFPPPGSSRSGQPCPGVVPASPCSPPVRSSSAGCLITAPSRWSR